MRFGYSVKLLLIVIVLLLSSHRRQKANAIPPRPEPQSPLITVAPNVQVSTDDARHAQLEGLLAADPNSKRLLGCTMSFNADDPQNRAYVGIAYFSPDGGLHWRATYRSVPAEDVMDPACAYGPDGVAYQTIAPRLPAGAANPLRVVRSDDGGEHWSEEVSLGVVLDRQFIVVDMRSPKYKGQVYVHGEYNVRSLDKDEPMEAALGLWRSNDGGKSFMGPAIRSAMGRRLLYVSGNSVVLSDGIWLAAFGELKHFYDSDRNDPVGGSLKPNEPRNANSWLKVVRSTDGGVRMEDPVTVADFGQALPQRSSNVPYVATDSSPSPFKDRVYLVWPNVSGDVTEIRFSYSADKGKTWSTPIVLNDQPAPHGARLLADAFMPMIAVNKDGVVGVAWYDRSGSADDLGWHVRFAASLDGGETWTPSVKVSEKPMAFNDNMHPPLNLLGTGRINANGSIQLGLAYNAFAYTGGHTSGMAADVTGAFHPYWVDNRTGVYQVWSTAVKVAGVATPNGDPALDDLQDVTNSISLVPIRYQYDPTTGLASITVSLRNLSNAQIAGPVKLRMLRSESDLAIITAMNSDNGLTSGGAIWEVTSKLPSGRLAPGRPPMEQELKFKISSVRPIRQGPGFSDFKFILHRFSIRVYARLQTTAGKKQ